MAKPEPSAQLATAPPKFGLNLGLAIWGVSAATALFIALYAATTEIGRERLFSRSLDARDGRRLAETVRWLAADQDRLLARIATLERSLDGITLDRARRAGRAHGPHFQCHFHRKCASYSQRRSGGDHANRR